MDDGILTLVLLVLIAVGTCSNLPSSLSAANEDHLHQRVNGCRDACDMVRLEFKSVDLAHGACVCGEVAP